MIQRALCHLCKIENHKTILYTVKGDIKIIEAQNACGMLHTRFQMVVNSGEGGRREQGRDGATAVRLVSGLSGKLKMLRNLKMKGITALRDPGPSLGRWSGGHMQDRLGREETEA